MLTNAAANLAMLTGACATMSLAFGLVRHRHPTRYMSAWFLAFLASSASHLTQVFEAWWGFLPWLSLLGTLSAIAFDLALWEGMRDFVGAPPLKPATARGILAVALAYDLIAGLVVANQPLIRVPVVILTIAVFVRVGWWQRQQASQHGYLGARLGLWALGLLASLSLIYPLSFYVPWIHDAGFLAWGVLLFLFGIGLLIMVFERSLAELQHLKEHLETEVARRSQELVTAERLAAIGQVAAGIAHEVKNKLTIVQAAAAMVTDLHTDVETQAAAGERLRRAVQDTNRMVREMMAMTGPRTAVPQPVDVRQMVEGLLPGLVPFGIRLVTAWSEAETFAIVEAKALEQVVSNVLINAVEAMGGTGVLTIATDRREGYICLQITDTGTGVAPEVREHRFEPFYSTKPDGNGLGLAISKRLIEQQGGLIALDGAPGQGARVTLLLPAGGDGGSCQAIGMS